MLIAKTGVRGRSSKLTSFSLSDDIDNITDLTPEIDGTGLWALSHSRRSKAEGSVVSIDVSVAKSTCCRDFIEGFDYYGLCCHPSMPQARTTETPLHSACTAIWRIE
jgi:hypothetical protein